MGRSRTREVMEGRVRECIVWENIGIDVSVREDFV